MAPWTRSRKLAIALGTLLPWTAACTRSDGDRDVGPVPAARADAAPDVPTPQTELAAMASVLDRLRHEALVAGGAEGAVITRSVQDLERDRAELLTALALLPASGAPGPLRDALDRRLADLTARVDAAYDRWLRDQPQELYRQGPRFGWERREDYRLAAETTLAALDRRAARLRLLAAAAPAAERDRLTPVLRTLELRKAWARETLAGFAEVAEPDWPEYRQSVQSALDALRLELEAAWRRWHAGSGGGAHQP